MKIFKPFALAALFLASTFTGTNPASAQETKPLFENNFEKAEVGSAPAEFLILDGEFIVKEEGGNKFLELPGAPLDTFGVLFGPTVRTNVSVSARINGTNKGRRYPTFGIGLDGQGGYKLQISPGKKALEIYKGDAMVASVPYEWKSGQWTTLQLQVLKAADGWQVTGKAWSQGEPEPQKHLISFDETKEPPTGRATLWGSPYATTPIQFDDLVVTRITPEK